MIGSHNQDFRSIPSLWPPLEGRRALDLGCGRGLYTRELARRGAWTVGVDPDPDSLATARRDTKGSGTHWVRADGTHLPFRAGVFGIVVSVEVLTHMPPGARQQALAEMARVSEDDAVGFVTLHNRTRLAASGWLRMRRPRQVYETNHLRVWPVEPGEAEAMAAAGGWQAAGDARYLNFHSRLSYRFCCAYPRVASLAMGVEELLCRAPGLRRLGITFLLCLNRREQAAVGGCR